MIVNINSYAVTTTINEARGWTEGTVEVTLGDTTKTVPAIGFAEYISVFGFVGQYRTGPKKWNANVRHYIKTGEEVAYFGRDDRSPKFKKLKCISFA